MLFPRDSQHLLSNLAKCNLPGNQQSAVSYEEGLQKDGVGLICGYFHFEQNAASSLLDILPDALVIQRKSTDGSIATLLDLMISESLRTIAGTEAVVDRLAEALFVIILREHTWKKATPAPGWPRRAAGSENPQSARKHAGGAEREMVRRENSPPSPLCRARPLLPASSHCWAKARWSNLTRWRMQVAYNLLDEEKLPVLEVAESLWLRQRGGVFESVQASDWRGTRSGAPVGRLN